MQLIQIRLIINSTMEEQARVVEEALLVLQANQSLRIRIRLATKLSFSNQLFWVLEVGAKGIM
jgi:hypothetical protein